MIPTIRVDPALLTRFQAVAEKTRLRIVQLLSEGERCVCELQADLDAAQSRLSFHLRKLKEAGIVSDRRVGSWIYYSLVPDVLEGMRSFLDEVKPRAGSFPVGGEGEVRLGCDPREHAARRIRRVPGDGRQPDTG